MTNFKKVNKITCENKAAFMMSFSVEYLSPEGDWTPTDWNSGSFPVVQAVTSPDFTSLSIPDDAIAVAAVVVAKPHRTLVRASSVVAVRAEDEGIHATYVVEGILDNFSVKLRR